MGGIGIVLRGRVLACGRAAALAVALACPAGLIASALAPAAALAQSADQEETEAFEALKRAPTIEGLQEFRQKYPFGRYREEAEQLLRELVEQIAWQEAVRENTREAFDRFIAVYPDSSLVEEAERRINALREVERLLIHPGMRLVGRVISQPLRPSPNECNAACTADTQCLGYDFSFSSMACSLYGQVDGRRADEGYTAGTRGDVPEIAPEIVAPPVVTAPPVAPKEFLLRQGVDFPGAEAEIERIAGISHFQCQEVCRGDSACQAYSYDISRSLCVTKTHVPAQVARPDVLSGHVPGMALPAPVAARPPAAADFVEEHGYDYPGAAADLRFVRDIDYADCQELCRRDTRCRAYTYNVEKAACFTKSGVINRIPFPGAISGYRQSGGGTTTATAPTAGNFRILNDRDLPGGDYDGIEDVTLTQCRAECAGSPRCRAFTYNSRLMYCNLKGRVNRDTRFNGAVSGIKR